LTKQAESISKPGYLKQRMKLNPQAIRALCDFHNSSIYQEEELETLKGYFILAADGSNINVPTVKETLALYGTSSNTKSKPQAAIGMSSLYDLLNKVILDVTINRNKFDDRGQAREHMKKFSEIAPDRKSIIVLDRDYPGAYEFIKWNEADQKFVIRLRDKDYKKEKAQMVTDDEIVSIIFDNTRMSPYRGTEKHTVLTEQGSINLRIVKIKTGGGMEVFLATNLSDKEFGTEEIGRIYQMRWGIETVFDMLKNNLEIENFTGTKPILIEQDIYACIYLCNLAQDMIADAEANNKLKGNSSYKHEMAVNKTYAVGVLKEDLIIALLERDFDQRTKMFEAMAAEIQSNLVPIRPDRHCERRKHNGNLSGKYSNTHKRSY
jgi:hypothetical protein